MIQAGWRRLTTWAGRTSRHRQRSTIAFDAEGFLVVSQPGLKQAPELRVKWSDIQKLGVFKRDLYVVDLVCLVVELPGPRTIELNEEMEGWQPFVEALPRFLVGAKPWHEWFMEVAFPAFDTKSTIVYSR